MPDVIDQILEQVEKGELTPEMLLEIEPLVKQEQARYNKAVEILKEERAIDFFKPNSKIQADAIGSLKRETWLFGGERSGKTTPFIARDIQVALGRHKLNKLGLISTPSIGWVCSEDSEHIIEVVQRLFMKYIPKDRLVSAKPVAKSTSRLRYKIKADDGSISEIVEKSYESGWKKHQGREVDWIHDDEQPPQLVYGEHIERLSTRKGYFWCSMTPTANLESGGSLWVYREIVQRALSDPKFAKDLWVGYISKWDNRQYLDESEIKRLEERYGKDSRDSHVRIYGQWDVWLTRVFDNWHDKYPYVVPDSLYEKIPEEHKTHYMGIDPHPQKPFALLWVDVVPRIENPMCKGCKWQTECTIRNHYFVTSEHFGDETKESRYTTKDYADFIKLKNGKKRMMATFIDKYADNNERNSGSSIRRDLYAYGIPTRVWINNQDAKDNRIENARSLFGLCQGGFPQVFVLESCKLTRFQFFNYEFEHYKNVGDGAREAIKRSTKKVNDDLCDAFMGTIEKRPPYINLSRPQQVQYIPLYEEAGF